MNLHEAVQITTRIDRETEGKKWDEIYPDVESLLADLKTVTIPKDGTAPYNLFRGYVYIYSFAHYLQQGGRLSEKQITQAKRLAREIKKAAAIESLNFQK